MSTIYLPPPPPPAVSLVIIYFGLGGIQVLCWSKYNSIYFTCNCFTTIHLNAHAYSLINVMPPLVHINILANVVRKNTPLYKIQNSSPQGSPWRTNNSADCAMIMTFPHFHQNCNKPFEKRSFNLVDLHVSFYSSRRALDVEGVASVSSRDYALALS